MTRPTGVARAAAAPAVYRASGGAPTASVSICEGVLVCAPYDGARSPNIASRQPFYCVDASWGLARAWTALVELDLYVLDLIMRFLRLEEKRTASFQGASGHDLGFSLLGTLVRVQRFLEIDRRSYYQRW